MDARHRTVFLTGATGVVGNALLPRLGPGPVVCLARQPARVGRWSWAEPVQGDVTLPDLGLGARYDEIASRVDAVIHCAALTGFKAEAAEARRTNVDGVANVVAFAERAEVPMIHVGTAFVRQNALHDDTALLHYARSKEEGEGAVRSSQLDYAILRPSIVIGSVDDGRISDFQGFYHAARAIIAGLAPVLPFEGDWLVDIVSQDVLVEAILTVLRKELWGAELWITSGDDAPTAKAAVDEIRTLALRLGHAAIPDPRYVGPDTFHRLIAPAFLPLLPPDMGFVAETMFRYFSPYLTGTQPFPSDTRELAPDFERQVGLDPLAALSVSLDYWAAATNPEPPRLQP